MSNAIKVTGVELREWANIARECKAGWGCAFISDVYKVARLLGAVECTLPEFKAAIASSADCRSVMSRCDLVGAFDRAVIAESDTTYMNATYNFIAR